MPLTRLAVTVALTAALPWTQAPAQGSGVVYGTVTDSGGAAIAGVQVHVTDMATATDAAGRYRLEHVPAGRAAVRFSRVGYRPLIDSLNVPAGDSVRADVVLFASALMVEPIIVTAAKRSQLLDQAVTSVALVSDTDLARRAVSTVDEAVNRAPGVLFLNGQVNIRGSSGFVEGLGSRVLLLVDGVPANEGDRGGIDWDLVPVGDVERVEIVKGAGSSLYGSAALGGVVNLITREVPLGLHARARATAGAYANPPFDVWRFRDHTGGLGGLDATASYGRGTLRGSLTLGGRHSDGYREQDSSDQWETAGKTEWRPRPGTSVTASGSWTSHQYQVFPTWCVPGASVPCNTRSQAFQPFMFDSSSAGSYTRSNKGYFAVTLDRSVSPRFSWQARGSWLRTHFTDFNPDDWGVSNRFGLELRGVDRTPSGRVATVGLEAARGDAASDIFGDHGQDQVGAYGETEQPLGRARVTAGARLDYLDVDGSGATGVLSPRVGAVLPSRVGTWRASAGRGFRAPTLAERFVRTRAFGFQVIPNPGLHPETAWSFEVGNTTALASWGRLDAALFWTEARELLEPAFVQVVDSTTKDTVQKIQIQNVSRARLRGLDASFTVAPLPALTGTLAYLWLDTRDLATGSVLAFRPKHLLTISTDYHWRSLSVGADFRYSSRIERIELEPVFGRDPRVAARVLDLRAGWQRGPWSGRLLVTNALNYLYNLVPRTLEPVRTISVVLGWSY
ncbi:MAG TPA: TonB-dependent receptor [Gemmatimonadales bacterium]|nr:TonB-dependent receptor [Gemmatimonadales bacterium]